MTTVYLSKKEAYEKGIVVDIKEYYDKYSKEKRNNSYSMLQGAPLVINIDGTYVYLNKIPTMDIKNKFLVEQLIAETRNPMNLEGPFVRFKWRA